MQCFYCMAESLIYGYRFLKGRLCCSAVGQCLPEMEYTMSPLKTISEKLAAWRRYRDAVRELSQLSNRELDDIGIRRGDIEFIVRRSVASQVSAGSRDPKKPSRAGNPARRPRARPRG